MVILMEGPAQIAIFSSPLRTNLPHGCRLLRTHGHPRVSHRGLEGGGIEALPRRRFQYGFAHELIVFNSRG